MLKVLILPDDDAVAVWAMCSISINRDHMTLQLVHQTLMHVPMITWTVADDYVPMMTLYLFDVLSL